MGDSSKPKQSTLSEERVGLTAARATNQPAGEVDEDWRKYRSYRLEVDPNQDDKAKEILVCSIARPHMRAFHCAWWAFFCSFFIWFAISPILPEIKDTLNLTNDELWTASIAGVGGTVFVRFVVGPLCDIYGARVLFLIMMCTASIPTACTGLIQSAQGLALLRLFIGIAGGTFVTCEYWTSRMFTKEVVGTANALVAGWGNLGAGVTQLVMGSILLPLFEALTGSTETAWRTVCIVPAVITFITGIVVYFISDDAPKGNYSELKQHGIFPKEITAGSSFYKASCNLNSWILFVQYACCFGVELTMNNAAALYFQDEFGQSKEAARAMAAIFGWLNLFARGVGGFVSDAAFYNYGMKGRIWAQTILLLAEGAAVFVFAQSRTLGGSIAALVVFSLFVQAAEGTSYGIVPYIDPPNMGSVAGIAGAGGNVGAVCFGLGFRELSYKHAFWIMGASILGSSLLSLFLVIPGYSGILWGKDCYVDRETGEVMKKSDPRVHVGEEIAAAANALMEHVDQSSA